MTRFFGASPWRFLSLLHARGETTGAATQRSMPSVLHLRTGVRIPPPPPFDSARVISATQPLRSRVLSNFALSNGAPNRLGQATARTVAPPTAPMSRRPVSDVPRPRMLARHPRVRDPRDARPPLTSPGGQPYYNLRVHFVYIVRCADGTLYTGYARDPIAACRHTTGNGARGTRGDGRRCSLIYSEA